MAITQGAPRREAGDVSSEIEQVERSGRYSPLPTAAEASSSATGDLGRYIVRNSTPYQLRLLLSGVVQREVTIAAGQSQTIDLPPGEYKILGNVAAPNVLPFLGHQFYKVGAEYRADFYIRNTP
jgi:hypothetical protein